MIPALEQLLDRARDALLAGDLAALSGLEVALDAETARLPVLEVATARRLQAKAQRNARLLQAASRGLSAARDRMADIAAGPGLATYDAKGRKAALSWPTAALGRF
jgi:hypothetical protein